MFALPKLKQKKLAAKLDRRMGFQTLRYANFTGKSQTSALLQGLGLRFSCKDFTSG